MNPLAYAALLLSIPAALFAFAMLRPPQAAAWSFLAASMFLPVASIDLELLPRFGKEEFTGLACLLGALAFSARKIRAARPGRGPEFLVIVMFIGSIFTFATNRDPLVFGPTLLPGTQPTDLLVPHLWLVWGVPFLLGRALFRRSEDLRTLLIALVAAALLYTPFILAELRLSPQFHRWVYGYHQHAFIQTMRDSGYRPMVFMGHGLVLSLFVALSLLAAVVLVRIRQPVFRLPAVLVVVVLASVLALCKSVGATLYAALATPVLALLSPRTQVRLAAALAAIVMAYPVLRWVDLVPVDRMLELSESSFGDERTSSLRGRLQNEKQVLDRASERPLFGWSGYARPMIWDPVTGENHTTFDGYWVLTLGEGGLIRYVSVFGLMLFPVWMAARNFGRIPLQRDRLMVAGLSFLVAIRALNMIPNTAIDPWFTLLSGALAGSVEGLTGSRRKQGRGPRGRSLAPARRPPPGLGRRGQAGVRNGNAESARP